MEIFDLKLDIPSKISTNQIYAGIHWRKRQIHKQIYRVEVLSKINRLYKLLKKPKTTMTKEDVEEVSKILQLESLSPPNKTIEIPDWLYPVNLTFEFNFKRNALDTSNCSYMMKLIEDALVYNKILKGDSPKHVGWVSFRSVKESEDLISLKIW